MIFCNIRAERIIHDSYCIFYSLQMAWNIKNGSIERITWDICILYFIQLMIDWLNITAAYKSEWKKNSDGQDDDLRVVNLGVITAVYKIF